MYPEKALGNNVQSDFIFWEPEPGNSPDVLPWRNKLSSDCERCSAVKMNGIMVAAVNIKENKENL